MPQQRQATDPGLILYTDEHDDFFVSNHGRDETRATRQGWANNVQDWSASREYKIDLSYRNKAFALPQQVNAVSVSRRQVSRGGGPRIRSMSMNAMVGSTGTLTNRFNPSSFETVRPRKLRSDVLFIDEHPDTISDGFRESLERHQWGNLPASYHNGASSLAFADGHTETHRWAVAGGVGGTVKRRGKAIVGGVFDIAADGLRWLKERTSYRRQ